MCWVWTLKIDIDIPYKLFKEVFLEDRLTLFNWAAERYKIEYRDVIIEESRHGNTHITVLLKHRVDCGKALRLKFLLGDDRRRVYFQLERLKAVGDPYDLFFR